MQKSTKIFVKEQAKQSEKANIGCPLAKFSRHCYSGIFHIPEDLRNAGKHERMVCRRQFWVKPKIREWLVG